MIGTIESGANALLTRLDPKPVWQWESKVLSETPGHRLVAHYRFRGLVEDRSARINESVGKFFADEQMGDHCFKTMNAIYQALKNEENPPLAIPEPLFYDRENKFLSLQWIGYRPYPELMNVRNYKHYLRMAGRSLAFLHRLPVDYGEVKTLENHLNDLITPHPLRLAELIPELAMRIRTCVDIICHLDSSSTDKQTAVPLHRDFHLRQLFCDSRKVWVIDWDMYSRGDPALDIGNFLVYLETKLADKSTPAKKAFLDGYCTLIPAIQWPNIRKYQALTYLRLACKTFRLQQAGWQDRTVRFLTACEKLLAPEQ